MVSSINKIVNKRYGKRDTSFGAVLKGLRWVPILIGDYDLGFQRKVVFYILMRAT